MTKESKVLIAILVGVVGLMVGVFALANSGSTPPPPTGDATKVIRDTSHSTGTGPVQLVEFGDYQCPACGAAEPNVQKLLQEYDGKVTFYFRNFPLVNIHKNANVAALAAEAAGGQDKFWQMHNKLYATQNDWENKTDPVPLFEGYAKELGLDTAKFKQDVADAKYQSVIDQDTADANALGVNSTPTFYFNGVKFTGKSSYEELKAKVDELLAAGATSPAASATPAATPAP